jgi:hypothetical protein
MNQKELKNLKNVYYEYSLPKPHFSEGSELSVFLKETKFCHGLFDYNYTNTKKEDSILALLTKDFYQDLAKLKANILKLTTPIETNMGVFTHIRRISKPGYNGYFLKPHKVYLLKKNRPPLK